MSFNSMERRLSDGKTILLYFYFSTSNNILSMMTSNHIPPNLGGAQQSYVPHRVDRNITKSTSQHSASIENLSTKSSQAFSQSVLNGNTHGSSSSGNLQALGHDTARINDSKPINNVIGSKTEHSKILADYKDKIENLDNCDSLNSNEDCPTFSQIYSNKFKHWHVNKVEVDQEEEAYEVLDSLVVDENTFKTAAMAKHRRTKSDQIGNDLCQSLSCHRSQSSHTMSSMRKNIGQEKLLTAASHSSNNL